MPVQSSQDLFASDLALWDRDPLGAFDTWLSQRRGRQGAATLQRTSATVYRVQWQHYVAYLQERGLTLLQVTPAQIEAFLASLTAENRHQRERYRQLLNRVYQELFNSDAPLGVCNPAHQARTPQQVDWKAVAGNRPTSFLSVAEREQLIAYLLSPFNGGNVSECWRERRDRAIVALCLGAGLKVSECQELTINCMPDPWHDPWLHLQPAGSQFAHRTQPMAFARQVLAHWRQQRAQSACLGERLFPAQRDGRPMHAVTLLRASNGILHRAGMVADQAGRSSPQTLRNTFAAMLFEAGEGVNLVGEWLGYAVPITAERLYAAWQQWCQRQA